MKKNDTKIIDLMIFNAMLGANLTLEESKLMNRYLRRGQEK